MHAFASGLEQPFTTDRERMATRSEWPQREVQRPLGRALKWAAAGHFQSNDRSGNRHANDKFQSTAGIGRWPLEGPQSGSASNFQSRP
jgi:hypothetical protein